MSRFTLAFGIHNHQPVGNFEAVFEDAHQKSYLPFLKLVESFPNVRLSLHQSGILWKWQKDHHPDYFELVGRLVNRGQIDLMTGGFYEPILSSIPERDVHGQIAMLTGFLKSHFGCSAEGLWLTERIWEPHLPKVLSESGVKFLPVDDTHFIYAGFEHAQLTGPFVTENEGKSVTLLPIQKKLRYLIPFGKVEDVINELRTQAEKNPSGVAVYADDGEKFGVWPETYRHCYEDRWLVNLFEAFERNRDWLEVTTLTTAANRIPVGRAYLPTASYEEMLHWALPTKAFVEYEEFEHWLKGHDRWERSGRFVRGGHWRGFLAKYEESNLMHKKMIWASTLVDQLSNAPSVDKSTLERAIDRLYASQCNCPYWHGVFGGLYLPHIRQAVYSAMIEAAHLCSSHTKNSPAVTQLDYDNDGRPEVILQNRSITAVVKPDRGGSLLSLSLGPQAFELTDTLSRRREGYHSKLAQAVAPGGNSGTASIHDQVLTKEEGLGRFLIEDWYLKRCLIDHFLPANTSPLDFAGGQYRESGDFILEPFEFAVKHNSVVMTRDGNIRFADRQVRVRMRKSVDLVADDGHLNVDYQLQTLDGESLEVVFAVENNFSFQAGHAEDRYVMIDGVRPTEAFLDAAGHHPGSHSIAMLDNWRQLGIAVTCDRAAEIWRMPIFTVSLSEGGFERVYQGTTLVHKVILHLSSQPTLVRFTIAGGDADLIRALVGASSENSLVGQSRLRG
jgi:alpha-amylase